MGLDLVTRSAAWEAYTASFVEELKRMAGEGTRICVFGDIDIEDHRRWCQRVCAEAGIRALHPLWKRKRRDLVEQFLDEGFAATIVVVQRGVLDPSFLGRRLDRQLIDDFERLGVDAAGENGEYHSVVTDGPLFASPIHLRHGAQVDVADRVLLLVDLA
jgi:uncharacterized protein (TIGR00290 family)